MQPTLPRLKPAAELAAAASKPYPNDSAEYREARTRLLAEEIELRRHLERVAALRRALPARGAATVASSATPWGDVGATRSASVTPSSTSR